MAAKITKFVNASPGPGYWYSQNVHVGFFSNNTRIQNGMLLVNNPSADEITLQGTFDATTPWANVYLGDGDTLGAAAYLWPGSMVQSVAATPTLYISETPGLPPIMRIWVEGANTANVWLAVSDS